MQRAMRENEKERMERNKHARLCEQQLVDVVLAALTIKAPLSNHQNLMLCRTTLSLPAS